MTPALGTPGAPTLADTLGLVAAHLDPSLVPPAAWRRTQRAARTLPAALSDGTYLECRLGAAGVPPPVDLIVRVDRVAARIVAGVNPVLALPPSLLSRPAWRQAAAFCTQWSGSAPWAPAVDHLWLEFDLATDVAAAYPEPSVFAALDVATMAGASPDDVLRIVLAVATSLGARVTRATARCVAEVLRAAPAGSVVPYVGVMLARAEPVLRVYLARVATEAWPNVLHAAGWPGDAGALGALLRALGPSTAIGMGHVDVAERVLPRVGLEYTFERRGQTRGVLHDAPLLDRLVRAGLCTASERDALVRWPGARRVALPHAVWESALARRVNCIKLVVDPPHPVAAKSYLLVSAHSLAARPLYPLEARLAPSGDDPAVDIGNVLLAR